MTRRQKDEAERYCSIMASSSAYRQTQIFLKKTRDRVLSGNNDALMISSRFRLIVAKGEVLGRLASQISYVLQGKDKPTFDRSKPLGDAIVVINASKIHLSGRKMEQKKFHRHTGYVGGLVTRTAKAMHARDETFLIRKAVERMLPDNQLRKEHLRKLRVFPNEEHPFKDLSADRLVPFEMPLRALKRSDGEDEYRLETESGNDDEEDDGWQSFNPKKKEELNKRYRKSLEAKRGWRMGQKGQQFVDLDD